MALEKEKEIVVAIEIGSSKIRGAAGYKNTDGSLQVLALEQADARNCIRKGTVSNIDKTVMCLKHIIEKIEEQLDKKVTKAYVGIGGQSLRTKKNELSQQFAAKTAVTQEMVDSLLEENGNTVYPGCEFLDVIAQEYRVGLDTTTDPVGVLSNKIEGTFLNVIARAEIRMYVTKCIEASGLKVAGFFVSPLAVASCVLTDAERRMGCTLIDFGYGTTTVIVFKNNLLRRLAVIPLGGNNITQDLCCEQMEEDEAEDLKQKYGSAFVETDDDEAPRKIPMSEGRTIDGQHFDEVVEAREEEILANIMEQIRNSGFQEKLLAGVVISGGASNIKNLDKAVKERLHVTKVRFVRFVPFAVPTSHLEKLTKDGSLNTLLSLLYKGSDNCVEEKATEPSVPSVNEEQPAEPKEESELKGENEGRKKVEKKESLWKRFKRSLENFTETVTEE